MRIIVIDHHVLFREGVASLLRDQPDMEVVGEAGSAIDAVECAMELKPDVILMEIGLPDGDGLETVQAFLSHQPGTAIVILTAQESDEVFLRALQLGVRGYLNKNTTKSMLLASLRALERGEVALSRRMVTKVVDAFSRIGRNPREDNTVLDALTSREVEVLTYLGLGVTNLEIAQSLFISENTVRVHVHNILDKLRVNNRREAGKLARKLGLVVTLGDHMRLEGIFFRARGEAISR